MTESGTTRPETEAPAIPSADDGLGLGRAVALLVAAVVLSVAASMIATAGTTTVTAGDEVPAGDAGPNTDPAPAAQAQPEPAAGELVPGDTIAISMTEFAYQPDELELSAGTYTFAITNDGSVPHEWALSEAGHHQNHLAQTRQLAAGETQEIEVTLEPGTDEYACHIPGHFEAGMAGTIRVTG